MKCKGCPKPIKKNERTHVEYANGKLVGTWHLKCWHASKKTQRWAAQGRTSDADPYARVRVTRDDIEALNKRREELAEDRAIEESPTRFDDWRLS